MKAKAPETRPTDEPPTLAARVRVSWAQERVRGGSPLDVTTEARLVTDAAAVVTDADAAASALLGVGVAQMRGEALAAFVHAADLGRLRLGLAELAREGALQIELRLVARRGPGVAAALSATRAGPGGLVAWRVRVSAASGVRPVEPSAARAPQGDVDERLAALQAALDERDRRLAESERQCAELTAARHERDLSMAVLAHELRGPLSAILGWARLLREPHVDARQRERALAVIEDNAQLQLGLVEDLVDASRLAALKLALDPATVPLDDVVARAVDGARPRAAARRVSLTCEARGRVTVRGDARRLSQVVSNLLANALKFTPSGGAVAVGVGAAGGLATLRVADTGVGIPADELPRVFERFHQGAHGAGAHGGLGLGLYLVREIVALHGGEVTAVSAGAGLGATFTVTLPAAG